MKRKIRFLIVGVLLILMQISAFAQKEIAITIDDPNGKELLNKWDKKNHLICNHSYSHLYFNSKSKTSEIFIADFNKGDSLIRNFKNYTKLFRFPYLKEGNTAQKRDSMRVAMKTDGYKNGYVTIDASDWYIDAQISIALKKDINTDLTPFFT